MTLGILRELHRSALTSVSWAESCDAVVRSAQSAACVAQARILLATIECLLIKEGANVDG